MVKSASEMPAETAPRPPWPDAAIERKALMMPMTVPKRPMNGAADEIDASPPRPFFRFAISRSLTRSMARLTASTTSNSPTSSGPVLAIASRPSRYSVSAS